jgi:hypothetical protein
MKNIDTIILFFFCIHKCFDPEEMLDSMPKLQSKSPTPQTESQYIPTQIKTVNSPTLPMKECRKGAKYLKCNAKSRANPTQMCPCLQTINQRWEHSKNTCTTPLKGLNPLKKQPYSARWKSQIWRKNKNQIKTDQSPTIKKHHAKKHRAAKARERNPKSSTTLTRLLLPTRCTKTAESLIQMRINEYQPTQKPATMQGCNMDNISVSAQFVSGA